MKYAIPIVAVLALAGCEAIPRPQTETGRMLSEIAVDAALRRAAESVGDPCLTYEAMLDAREAGQFDIDSLTPDERSVWAVLDRHCAAPEDRLFQ